MFSSHAQAAGQHMSRARWLGMAQFACIAHTLPLHTQACISNSQAVVDQAGVVPNHPSEQVQRLQQGRQGPLSKQGLGLSHAALGIRQGDQGAGASAAIQIGSLRVGGLSSGDIARGKCAGRVAALRQPSRDETRRRGRAFERGR